ncbi:hypothetical protein SHKM778_86420 [Streptomyces sp. KM77-8]|uniref:ABC transporter domain-containing protein n=1 Tax=Streptomyces haneummycinicus TaxID=3074435 RepID=A0AAT9HXK7_9ACTN
MAVNLVNVENVSKVYGTRALLDGISLGVSEGDRIGVVGRNGDGKTTLIRMLARLEEADTGRVTHSGGLRIGVLTQHDSSTPPPPSATRSSATWPTTSGPGTPRSGTY